MFLNHAATNPVFSFLTTLGDHTDYASEYPFFDEETRAAKFDALRGNGPASGPSERVLTKTRPNVVVVILESFARTVMDADVDGQPVMPNMRRLRDEGIWFENFFRQFVPHRPRRSGGAERISGSDAHVDHEASGQEPQPAVAGPVAGP